MNAAIKLTVRHIHMASFLLFYCTSAMANFIALGVCPNVRPSGDVTLEGTWFEQRRYDTAIHHFLRCMRYVFGEFKKGVATIDIDGFNLLTGRHFEFHGKVMAFPSDSFKIFSAFFSSNIFQPQNFVVLGISPNDWVTLFSCINYGLFHAQQVIVLTADRIPSASTIEAALSAVSANSLPRMFLKEFGHGFC